MIIYILPYILTHILTTLNKTHILTLILNSTHHSYSLLQLTDNTHITLLIHTYNILKQCNTNRYWKEPNTSSDNRKSHTILTSDIRRVMWSIGDEYWLVECNGMWS